MNPLPECGSGVGRHARVGDGFMRGRGSPRRQDGSFMDNFDGNVVEDEYKRRADRLRRGVCPTCGRPFVASGLDGDQARVTCRQGHIEYAKRGSHLFRLAASGLIGGR